MREKTITARATQAAHGELVKLARRYSLTKSSIVQAAIMRMARQDLEAFLEHGDIDALHLQAVKASGDHVSLPTLSANADAELQRRAQEWEELAGRPVIPDCDPTPQADLIEGQTRVDLTAEDMAAAEGA